jgi:hypothetical protein
VAVAYISFLYAHSWLRWLVLATAGAVLARCAYALAARRPWSSFDRALARAWVGATDVQLAVGLVLFSSASPLAAAARRDVVPAWGEPALRFFGFLHPALMVAVVVATHATWIAARRVDGARARFRRLGFGATGAVALLVAGVPWPSLPYGRPLVRASGGAAAVPYAAAAPRAGAPGGREGAACAGGS